MTLSKFEFLPADIFFEIFAYLSPNEILQSFSPLNKRFSRMIRHEYLWHIHIGSNTMSLSMFNYLCQNVLRLIGARVVSLRITLTNVIGGWSLVSSSLKYQTILLRRLHLIGIKPHEFDKLLRCSVIKQLHTLLVDVTKDNPFTYQVVQGAYLAKVCSQLPALTNCCLPFDFCSDTRDRLPKDSAAPLMTLPNLSHTTYLRSLRIGMNTSHFLERLLLCVPLIENLSVGVRDSKKYGDDKFTLPAAVDTRLLHRLSRLSVNCVYNRSFHRAIALFSSVFGQLIHLSLKLDFGSSDISDPFIVSGDTVQQLCIDRLKPCATYTLDLLLIIGNDLYEKKILNSFFNAPFTHRQRPTVIIQENSRFSEGRSCSFFVYTVPYNGTILETSHFAKYLHISHQMSVSTVKLFSHANELSIEVCESESCLSDLGNCRSSISLCVPWSLIRKISVDNLNTISAAQLASILQSAYNIHTLELFDEGGDLIHALLHNDDNLGTTVNQQIQSLHILGWSLRIRDTQDFCTLFINQLSNLKNISFDIFQPVDGQSRRGPCNVVDWNESSKHIVNLIRLFLDHLKQLVSLHIRFQSASSVTSHFPHLIRRQLHELSFNRSYRFQCFSDMIQIWL